MSDTAPVDGLLAGLAPMDVATRVQRLRSQIDVTACDALLVTSLVNIRYLTGFTGSAALLLVRPDGLVFVTDGRYGDQAAQQLADAGVDARIEVSNDRQRAIMHDAASDVARIGLEAEHVSWSTVQRYEAEWFPDAEVVATVGLVEALRALKDDGEVARIEAAAAVADAALGDIRASLADRPTERDFALELDSVMRRLGATAPSFETIVASGPNGARPHARPGPRIIEDGDLVVIDFGALVDGYCSDMTRTVMVGAPTETQARMFEVVVAAQQAGVDAVRDGVEAKVVDAACREVITQAGWGDAFLHATGHGVGLEIHEAPRVAATADATLTAGNVVTVEPGVYLPDHGGVRIEDTVVVTTGGCRPLTRTRKEFAAG